MYIRENAGPLAIALWIGVAVGATASFFITRHILNREDDRREEALSTAREVILKQQSTVADLQERLAEPKDEVVYIAEDEVEEEEDYSDEPVLIDFETGRRLYSDIEFRTLIFPEDVDGAESVVKAFETV